MEVLNQTFVWTGLALCLLGAVLVLAAIHLRPRGARRHCPGPRPSWPGRLTPTAAFVRGRCGYDLSGLEPDSGDSIRCPECGRTTAADQRLRAGPRLRLGRLAGLVFMLAAVALAVPPVRTGAWLSAVPTSPLVLMARSSGRVANARPVRREIDRRVTNGAMRGWQARVLAKSLARQLRDDDVRWNAEQAEDLLDRLWPESRAVLEAAIQGDDVQARILAARVLRRRSERPSDALLKACVKDLRDDRDEVRWYLSVSNARQAAAYLLTWSGRARPHLARALDSDDPQQRLLAAAVLAHAGDRSLMHRTVPILVEHLRDNDIPGDAKIAAPALYRLGPAASDALRPFTDSTDVQKRAIVLAIIERLEHPERPLHRREHPMPRITARTHEPLTDLSLTDGLTDF